MSVLRERPCALELRHWSVRIVVGATLTAFEVVPGQWIRLLMLRPKGDFPVVSLNVADALLSGVAPDAPTATRTIMMENTMP